MVSDETRKIIQNIVEGVSLKGQSNHLTATRNLLCTSFSTSKKIKKDFERQSGIKKEQAGLLKTFAKQVGSWLYNFPDKTLYLTEGGEASIYFGTDSKTVVKVNDAVYYNTWLDYLNSVLIHNLLFEDTAYELLGFTESNNVLSAIVKQPFIISDGVPDLDLVKTFLAYNGFNNIRRNDYYNQELGLTLEDIHDENVIINSGKIFFIDTVFYINVS